SFALLFFIMFSFSRVFGSFTHRPEGPKKTVRRRTPHGNNNANMKLRSIIESDRFGQSDSIIGAL
ncbi:MAG: hypothetical protein ACTSW1_08540, partial [Candidatus Hodarchaeales archaeon]